MEVLKVSSKSKPNSVAGALANAFKDKQGIEIQAIGAGALNQAIKAIAIARGYVAPTGKDLICVPAFSDIEIDGEQHYVDERIVESDKRRSRYLEDLGWTVFRIRWAEYQRMSLQEKQEVVDHIKKLIDMRR